MCTQIGIRYSNNHNYLAVYFDVADQILMFQDGAGGRSAFDLLELY
jgi:hypothetical protein